MRVLVFGDSITYGLWDTQGGWVDRLKSNYLKNQVLINNTNDISMYNQGIDGDTTTLLLERLETEIKVRLWPGEKTVIVFAIGINDALVIKEKPQTTINSFTQNLKDILNISERYADTCLFINLTPVNEPLTNPIASSRTGKCYTNSRINIFNNELKKFCNNNKKVLIDINDVFLDHKQDLKALLFDGLHPNDEGHELIYKTVKPYIDKLLEE